MLPLRHAALWRFLSVLLLLSVLTAALLPAFWFDSKVKALVWFENIDKWMHGLTFATLSVWFSGMFARRSYWLIAVGLMMFGLIIEGCQLLAFGA